MNESIVRGSDGKRRAAVSEREIAVAEAEHDGERTDRDGGRPQPPTYQARADLLQASLGYLLANAELEQEVGRTPGLQRAAVG